MNRIYFGSGCYGVETASQSYFGKNASKLNLSEAALLAGLIRSPNRFSPLKNPEGAAVQRDTVLDRMLELKKITAAQAEQAKHDQSRLRTRNGSRMIQENYAMDAVQRDLNLLLTPDQIDNGGLYIYTTLDPDVQKAATTRSKRSSRKSSSNPASTIRLKAQYHAAGGRRGQRDAVSRRRARRDRQRQRRHPRARRRPRLCAEQIQSRARAGQSPGRFRL